MSLMFNATTTLRKDYLLFKEKAPMQLSAEEGMNKCDLESKLFLAWEEERPSEQSWLNKNRVWYNSSTNLYR